MKLRGHKTTKCRGRIHVCVPLFTFLQRSQRLPTLTTRHHGVTRHTCLYQVQSTLLALCHNHLAAFIYEVKYKQVGRESRWRLQMDVNLCQPCCAASCRHNEKQKGEEVCFGLAWCNKAVFYRYTEKPPFNENPDRVQVRVRKSEWPF